MENQKLMQEIDPKQVSLLIFDKFNVCWLINLYFEITNLWAFSVFYLHSQFFFQLFRTPVLWQPLLRCMYPCMIYHCIQSNTEISWRTIFVSSATRYLKCEPSHLLFRYSFICKIIPRPVPSHCVKCCCFLLELSYADYQ